MRTDRNQSSQKGRLLIIDAQREDNSGDRSHRNRYSQPVVDLAVESYDTALVRRGQVVNERVGPRHCQYGKVGNWA